MTTEQQYNIDFKNLNKGQEMRFMNLLHRDDEKREKLKYVNNYYKDDRRFVYAIVITDEIIVAEMRNPVDNGKEFFYETFVNDRKVLESGSYSLEGAILLGIASKFGDARAAVYMAKSAGFEL